MKAAIFNRRPMAGPQSLPISDTRLCGILVLSLGADNSFGGVASTHIVLSSGWLEDYRAKHIACSL